MNNPINLAIGVAVLCCSSCCSSSLVNVAKASKTSQELETSDDYEEGCSADGCVPSARNNFNKPRTPAEKAAHTQSKKEQRLNAACNEGVEEACAELGSAGVEGYTIRKHVI